ncbi:DNA-binding response OmpR family regulator [Bradyrhizobium sp. JR6.1]
MRLLVVEDDPDLNRQLTTALTDAGYVVDRAFDGEEGHFLGDSEPYDAVVLDIGLPKMDGISVLEAWRRNKRVMPVLILTPRATAGATRFRGSMPAPTTMSQSPSIWRRCWRGSARCCAARPGMPRSS